MPIKILTGYSPIRFSYWQLNENHIYNLVRYGFVLLLTIPNFLMFSVSSLWIWESKMRPNRMNIYMFINFIFITYLAFCIWFFFMDLLYKPVLITLILRYWHFISIVAFVRIFNLGRYFYKMKACFSFIR